MCNILVLIRDEIHERNIVWETWGFNLKWRWSLDLQELGSYVTLFTQNFGILFHLHGSNII